MFRFAVALDARITAPVQPLEAAHQGRPPILIHTWALACDEAAEEARYARLQMISVMARDETAEYECHISLAEYVANLCRRFESHFRVSLFDELEERSEAEEKARACEEQALIDETRACAALLLAHDARIQRLVLDDTERFFACTPPPVERAVHFMQACQCFATCYAEGSMEFAHIGTAAMDAWIFG